jgi:UPF0755 protein
LEQWQEAVTAANADPASVGLPAVAVAPGQRYVLEGWLAPGTYSVAQDDTAQAVLTRMAKATMDYLTEQGVPQDQWLRTLTLASIVEREVNRAEYRPKVARVFLNRINKGWPLGSDVTVGYGLDKSPLDLTNQELSDTSNLYNTRANVGLPPGPIASPGTASIDAVLHPDDGTWMYFCTVNLETGETKFATTNAEWDAIRREFKDWYDTWPGRTDAPAQG